METNKILIITLIGLLILGCGKVDRENIDLEWPVEVQNITQKYRPQGNTDHEGIDLSHYLGAPIYSAHKAVVFFEGHQTNGYGNTIVLTYNDIWATRYAHLDKIYVSKGQEIEASEIIGTMGQSGNTTGPHLHFELLEKNSPVNPLTYLPKL